MRPTRSILIDSKLVKKLRDPITAGIIGGVGPRAHRIREHPWAGFNELSLVRWLHILSGVMWVGLLYYVSVAQIPAPV